VAINPMKARTMLAMLMLSLLVALAAGGCAVNNGATDEDAVSYAIRHGGWNH
jgi:hypothetical protein